MRIIICGAGQVGYHIAAYLSNDENNVTLIDLNADLISEINNELDVNGIVGHASNPDVLSAAGANDADMIIAVTMSDEVNMVACQAAHSLFGVPKKIARIREQSYLNPAWSNLFSRAHMPIDVIISPEIVIAEDIYQRLSVPGTTTVIPLADEKIHVIGMICDEDCPIIRTPLKQLSSLFSDLSFEVLAVHRNNKSIIPWGEDELFEGDEVFFAVDTKHLARAMSTFGQEGREARRIVIMGGGGVGYGLARLLREKAYGTQIKIIERNENRAKFLSEQLEDVIILNGDGLDKDLLYEAGADTAETFVAVTDDDENNILGSLLAKQYGCQRVMTLVNNNAYSPLVGPLGVDAMISPRSTIAANVTQHVRRGRIRGVYSLREGFAEIIEAEVTESSPVVNKALEDIKIPDGMKIGAILRKDEVLMPRGDQVLKSGDFVVLLATRKAVKQIEKLFAVQVDIF